MKKLMKTLSCAVAVLALAACGSVLPTLGTISDVKQGMTPDEVKKVLGQPDFRRFKRGLEQWEYKWAMTDAKRHKRVVLDFYEGKLISMDSYEEVDPSALSPVMPFPVPAPSDGHRPQLTLMDRRDFQTFYNKVKEEPFKDDQFELLAVGTKGFGFTCRQCVQLMSLFPFDDEKMRVLDMVADRIADPKNAGEIAESFTSLFKRDEVKKRFGLPTDNL